MKKLIRVIFPLITLIILISTACAEPLQFGAKQPDDGTMEIYAGKQLHHNKEMEQNLEKIAEHGTFFRFIRNGRLKTHGYKFKKNSFKVIGVYEYNKRDLGGYVKCLVRMNGDAADLWWAQFQGLFVDNGTPGDLHIIMHKNGNIESYADSTTIDYMRTRY